MKAAARSELIAAMPVGAWGSIGEIDRQGGLADIKDRVGMVDVFVAFGFAPIPVFRARGCAGIYEDHFCCARRVSMCGRKSKVGRSLCI